MRVIIALCATVMLAACAQGHWDAGRTSYSFSFDSGLSAPVSSRVAEPLATPPFPWRPKALPDARGRGRASIQVFNLC